MRAVGDAGDQRQLLGKRGTPGDTQVMVEPDLLSDEDVWSRVRAFAEDRLRTHTPVFTLTNGVRNYISNVKPRSIGRLSDQGTTSSSRVGRQETLDLWAMANGREPTGSGRALYFARALLVGALPEFLTVRDGEPVRRSAPRQPKPDIGLAESHACWALVANPETYRVDEAVRSLERAVWTTKGKEVRRGDLIAIWRARGRGQRRGIVGLARVVADPKVRTDR